MEPIAWLSTAKAAEYLGVALRTLYRMIDTGEIAGHQFGRVIRIKQSDLDHFLQQARITPGSLSHLYPPRVANS